MRADQGSENLQVEGDSRNCLDRVTSPNIQEEKNNEVIKNSADVGIAAHTGRL
jgi:hypothetical protein